MADIAAIFHWPPDVLDRLSLDQLVHWQDLAVDRWNRMNKAKE